MASISQDSAAMRPHCSAPLAALAFAGLVLCGACVHGEVAGELISQGRAGDWRLIARRCVDPARGEEGFVVLVGDGGVRVGINAGYDRKYGTQVFIIDLSKPMSDAVMIVEHPLSDELPRAAICRRLRANLVDNDSWRRDGEIDLDCDFPHDGHVVGHLTFSNCR